MAWESVDHILESKPKVGSIMNFDFAQLPIESPYSHRSSVLFGEIEAQEHIKPIKSTAGYAAYIDQESFKVSKKLENEAKKIFKMFVKYCKFELERVAKAEQKKSKTCSGCKTLHPMKDGSPLHKDTLDHIKRLEKLIEHYSSLDYSKICKINFQIPFEKLSCLSCNKENVLMTDTSSNKLEQMKKDILNLHTDFKKHRNEDADKQSKKKGAKILYYVRALVHESQIDNDY